MASKTLALNTRRLAADWAAIYGHPVLVAETFVDPRDFTGTAYRAAGWRLIGESRGFARQHRRYVRHGQPKALWVRPLRADASSVLAAPFVPATLTGGALTMVDFNHMNWTGPNGLRDRIRTVPDPRHRRGVRHAVDQVLVLAIAAVLAGPRS